MNLNTCQNKINPMEQEKLIEWKMGILLLIEQEEIVLDLKIIKVKPSMKALGVILDNRSDHVDTICQRIRGLLCCSE